MTKAIMTDQRNLLIDDYHRPHFHYLPPSNWMNDPNGVIQFNGKYHLFYQYNPFGATHENMHWGHAVSDDLVTWEDLPVALSPTPNSVDERGIFSGCAVDNNGTPTIFYTGVTGDNYVNQVQCMAVSYDELLTWEKYENNPVISDVPDEANQTEHFRDPFVWQGDDSWYMLVGSGIEDIGGTVFLYESNDLVNWEYKNPLMIGDKDKHGTVWECPNFFELDGKWVLIISDWMNIPKYFVGSFENNLFTPEVEGVFDHAYMFAPLSFLDNSGRRIIWGWIREGRSPEVHAEAGWAGVQCIPRELRLDAQNRLVMSLVPELVNIRGAGHFYEDAVLEEQPMEILCSRHVDISATFVASHNGHLQLELASSSDGREATSIQYDYSKSKLIIDRLYATNIDDVDDYRHEIEHILDEGEDLQLRIILDGSVCEIIANGRTSVTTRIYSSTDHNDAVRVSGKNAAIKHLAAYEMPSIWQ